MLNEPTPTTFTFPPLTDEERDERQRQYEAQKTDAKKRQPKVRRQPAYFDDNDVQFALGVFDRIKEQSA